MNNMGYDDDTIKGPASDRQYNTDFANYKVTYAPRNTPPNTVARLVHIMLMGANECMPALGELVFVFEVDLRGVSLCHCSLTMQYIR